MTSNHWDFLCTYARRKNKIGVFHGSSLGGLTARTADPRLNPGAVGITESSTNFRKSVEKRWVDLAELKRGVKN